MATQDSHQNADTQYIANAFISWPLHEAERLVLPDNGLHPKPLHETLAQVLVLCDRWRSIDGHLAAALEKLPQLQPHAQQVRQGLQHMLDQGLLVDATTLSKNYTNDITPKLAHEGIQTLYVRTYCCPSALERLLQSLQAGRAGASVRTLVVIDDARDESDIERSRKLLASYQGQHGAELIHVTRQDRKQLANALAAATGTDAEYLQWWLNGDPNDPEMTAGATFNTALLLSAGTATAIMDDDAQLVPYGDPQDNTQMSVANSEEVHWTMYPDYESMDSAWASLDIDPLAEHSRWLGQSLPSILAQTSSPDVFWQSINSSDLHTLKPCAAVKVSVNGLIGDPGTGGGSWLYTLPAEQLKPWLESEDTYRRLTSRRLMARKPLGQRLLPRHNLLSPLVGIDNQNLMPPTFPNGRGEDLLFAELVGCVYPDSLFAQLPWMLKHIPEQEREFDQDSLLSPARASTCSVLAQSLRELRHAIPSATPETRLQWLGHSLKAIAQAPTETLAEDCRRHLVGERAFVAEKVIKNLQALNPPAYLAQDMQMLIQRSCQSTESDQSELETVLSQTYNYAERYSQALSSWQTAWEHCRQLGETQVLAMAKTQ